MRHHGSIPDMGMGKSPQVGAAPPSWDLRWGAAGTLWQTTSTVVHHHASYIIIHYKLDYTGIFYIIYWVPKLVNRISGRHGCLRKGGN